MARRRNDMKQGWLRLYLQVIALVFIVLLAPGNFCLGQVSRLINTGNSLYGQKKFKEAEANYTKAVTKNPNNTPALFNLGNTLYQQKKYDSSRKVMEATARLTKDKGNKAAVNYNIGNTYMSQQKWQEAIDAYKKTLRSNPQDADAKYNLSYAEQMLKKQQQEDKDNKDKKDKDKKEDKDKQDQQNKDKKDDKDKQDQEQQKEGDKKDDQKQEQRPQGQPSKLSQQQAEQLLNALQQEEKKLQDKMKKEKGAPVRMERDW